MGKWYYWTGVIVVFSLGITASLYFGLQGKTIPYIKWSYFANSLEVSNAVEMRLREELQPYQIYFLGPSPGNALQVEASLNLAKWLRQSQDAILIEDPTMVEKIPDMKAMNPELTLDLSKDSGRLIEGVRNIGDKKKIIVIAPNIYVTQISLQSPVSQMKSALQGRKYVVLSFMNFPRSHEQEKDSEFLCHTSDSAMNNLDLGCFVLAQSRPFYGKSDVPGKTPGFLNQVRGNEYMFFLGQ